MGYIEVKGSSIAYESCSGKTHNETYSNHKDMLKPGGGWWRRKSGGQPPLAQTSYSVNPPRKHLQFPTTTYNIHDRETYRTDSNKQLAFAARSDAVHTVDTTHPHTPNPSSRPAHIRMEVVLKQGEFGG